MAPVNELPVPRYTDYNVVISVDWQRSHRFLDALQALANSELMAREVTHLAHKLIKHRGVRPANLYLLCMSMGCTSATFASRWARRKFNFRYGRLTAMDAPGVVLQRFPSTAITTDVRSDDEIVTQSVYIHSSPSSLSFLHVVSALQDADFVDAIHSSSGSNPYFTSTTGLRGAFGIEPAIGHVDFYVNGGRHQPHCILSPFPIPWCSHLVARRMFLFSIRTCTYRTTACKKMVTRDRESPCRGNSTRRGLTSRVGFHSIREKGRGPQYYKTTNFIEPYC